jgi:3-isopropylmalate/(R)-2-methylmalate dehydratase large subunit
MKQPQTLFEKVWNRHAVVQEPDSPAILYIDLHLIHEVTSPQAFTEIRERGLKVRRPDKTFAVVDHGIPTLPGKDGSIKGRMEFADDLCRKQIEQLEINCADFGITLFGLESSSQGVVHVVGPEMGLTQPGMTIVCGDSHTATHGAFGALAFGVGTSEVGHVLATQCLLQKKPETYEVRIDGKLKPGVMAKDIILGLIAKIGIGGGTGCVFEYTGSGIHSLSMEERMTVCNMSIEAGARAGLVAPDDETFNYIHGRPYAPKREKWDQALNSWQTIKTDEGAVYGNTVTLDASDLEPMITYGTNPGMGMSISGRVPDPKDITDANQKSSLEKALNYMGLQPGEALLGKKVDVVFIGSCTNGRLVDLRAAAGIMKGKKVADGMRVLIVPGSQAVKKQAESEGLDRVFKESGADWREPGCSMCIGMNGDQIEAGQYAVSTSNRNFEGRQGKGGRTLLASPMTAAAAALTGKVSDPRLLLSREQR